MAERSGSREHSRRSETDELRPSAVVNLTRESVQAIAASVVELLDERQAHSRAFVDAQELAQILGVSRGTVYEHARDLGAIRIGTGARARLRFDVAKATAALRGDQRAPRMSTARPLVSRHRPRRFADCDLLPIRNERPLRTERR